MVVKKEDWQPEKYSPAKVLLYPVDVSRQAMWGGDEVRDFGGQRQGGRCRNVCLAQAGAIRRRTKAPFKARIECRCSVDAADSSSEGSQKTCDGKKGEGRSGGRMP